MSEAIYLITKEQYDHLKNQLELILRKLNYDSFERERKWISAQETMEMLNIGRTTLWRYQKEGIIKVSRIGRKLHFNRDDIEELLFKNSA